MSDPLVVSAEQAQRFWSYVTKGNGCWNWQRSRNRNGYGQFGVSGRKFRAHRLAYQLHHGIALTVDILVCHRCDNRVCCNPDHLFAGTTLDNMQDMARKGRAPNKGGETTANHKLSIEDVRLIRADPRGYRTLGRLYGVDRTTIRSIKTGRTWAGFT